MSRPVRTSLSIDSMVSVIGIPRKFVRAKVSDIYADSPSRAKLKQFVGDYASNIVDNFESCRGLYMYGSNGVGKTFISSLILKEAYRHRYSCHRISFMEYCSIYTRVWDAKSLEDREVLEAELYEYKATEFLVLEEIGKGVENSVTVPILEDLLRYREDKGLVTIIATNLSPMILKEQYGKSVYSLITGNCVPVKIEDSDRRKEEFAER